MTRVTWRVAEHELRHGTAVAPLLRANGLPSLDF